MALTASYKSGYYSRIYRKHDNTTIPSHAEEMGHRFLQSVPTSRNVTWNRRQSKEWQIWLNMKKKHVKGEQVEDGKTIFKFSDNSQLIISREQDTEDFIITCE